MDKKNEVKKLFSAGFRESAEWTDWFFNCVYRDENALIAYDGDQPAACLMLDPYQLKLGETTVDMGYISCCTTSPKLRRRGYMTELLNEALRQSAQRGYAVASLIPASERLYFFYDHLGFSTVFYADEQRYTSLHQFLPSEKYTEVDVKFDDFHQLELQQRSIILHSESDFKSIIDDISLDGGYAISIRDSSTGQPAAMIFATVGQTAAKVKSILSVSDEASDAAFAILREKIGERMIIAWVPPSGNPYFLKSRGMGRIVNVDRLLSAIAARNPNVEQTIRVHDSLLPDNNGVFIMRRGRVEKTNSTIRRLTLDVSVETLAKIIFNSDRIGDVFSIPTFRPTMSLMLD